MTALITLAALAVRNRLARRRVGERDFWHGHTRPHYGDNE